MTQPPPRRRSRFAPWLVIAVVVIGGLAAARGYLLRWRAMPAKAVPFELPPGLTQAEAEARYRQGRDDDVQPSPVRSWARIQRESIFIIFNLNLIGLSLVQLLLREWLSAFLTLVMLALSTTIRVVQERLAARRVTTFLASARARYTVVRDGRTRSVDPERVVRGDVLLVGPGDELLADGRLLGPDTLVVDTYAANGNRTWRRVGPGGQVLGGSCCVSGRGLYVAERLGSDRLMNKRLAAQPMPATHLTPLERLMGRILQLLLGLVVVYGILFVAAYLRLDIGAPGELFVDAAPVIFNLAPSGLYLMIIVNYATGTADLAQRGVLVSSARSVESLAETTVLCFTEIGILAGTSLELRPVRHAEGEHLPESRLRQVLGYIARSTSATSWMMRVLADSLEGERRAVREEAPHLATRGWLAISFEDPDLDGVFVLGEPHALAGHLTTPLPDGQQTDDTETLVVAYRPDRVPLTDILGRARVPDNLIALGTVQLARQLHPEALDVVRGFLAAGVQIKAFAPGSAADALAALREAGMTPDDLAYVQSHGMISRAELEQTPRSEWGRVAQEHAVYGGLTSVQVGELVRALREQGEVVAVVGDGVTDLPALLEASLAVAQPASTQAALRQADIFLLNNSPKALLGVLGRGQAIVSGLVDVIKLNLTMVTCTALLIVTVRLTSVGFPYISAQESAINIFTVTIPSLALGLWPGRGVFSRGPYGRSIARFVLPAGVSLSLVASGVYQYFMQTAGRVAYAQQAVSFTVLYAGLLVGYLTRPSRRTGTLALVLAAVATLLPGSVPTRWLFRLEWLASPRDYAVVLAAVVCWALLVLLAWRLLPPVDGSRQRRSAQEAGRGAGSSPGRLGTSRSATLGDQGKGDESPVAHEQGAQTGR